MRQTFWFSVGALAYTWVVYPALIRSIGAALREREVASDAGLPLVTVVITAHNEQSIIATKLDNTLSLDYPPELLDVVVASDASTDGTDDVVLGHADPRVRLYRHTPREGKTAAQNAAIQRCRGDVVLLTGTDTTLDTACLRHMVAHFARRDVGCVAGRLVWMNEDVASVAKAAGLYWRFELALWESESRMGIMAWAPGGAMAVRRFLLKPIDPRYGEDCMIPLDVVEQRYRVVYEPNAIAYDAWPSTPAAEFRTRRRMTLRSFGGTLSAFRAWNPLRRPLVAWAVISHKLLRWLTPIFLFLLLLVNVALIGRGEVYALFMLVQGLFYATCLLGYLAHRRGRYVPLLSPTFHFCLSLLAMGIGVIEWVARRDVRVYEPQRSLA